MNTEEILQQLLGLMQAVQNIENPPMETMEYDPPIAEAKMQILDGGIMQFRTASSTWRDADELADGTGTLGISTIQQDGDGNDLPTSNRITALRWKPDSGGVPQNLVVRRV